MSAASSSRSACTSRRTVPARCSARTAETCLRGYRHPRLHPRRRRGRRLGCQAQTPARALERRAFCSVRIWTPCRCRRPSSRCSSMGTGRTQTTASSARTTRLRWRSCWRSRATYAMRARRSTSSCCSRSGRRSRWRAPTTARAASPRSSRTTGTRAPSRASSAGTCGSSTPCPRSSRTSRATPSRSRASRATPWTSRAPWSRAAAWTRHAPHPAARRPQRNP